MCSSEAEKKTTQYPKNTQGNEIPHVIRSKSDAEIRAKQYLPSVADVGLIFGFRYLKQEPKGEVLNRRPCQTGWILLSLTDCYISQTFLMSARDTATDLDHLCYGIFLFKIEKSIKPDKREGKNRLNKKICKTKSSGSCQHRT